jgi:hypothetical protein
MMLLVFLLYLSVDFFVSTAFETILKTHIYSKKQTESYRILVNQNLNRLKKVYRVAFLLIVLNRKLITKKEKLII